MKLEPEGEVRNTADAAWVRTKMTAFFDDSAQPNKRPMRNRKTLSTSVHLVI